MHKHTLMNSHRQKSFNELKFWICLAQYKKCGIKWIFETEFKTRFFKGFDRDCSLEYVCACVAHHSLAELSSRNTPCLITGLAHVVYFLWLASVSLQSIFRIIIMNGGTFSTAIESNKDENHVIKEGPYLSSGRNVYYFLNFDMSSYYCQEATVCTKIWLL